MIPTDDQRIALVVPPGDVAVLTLLQAGQLRAALRNAGHHLDYPSRIGQYESIPTIRAGTLTGPDPDQPTANANPGSPPPSEVPPLTLHAAEYLGGMLRAHGFRPLPEVHDGVLAGTRLWRILDGYIECLTLRYHGPAHAIRAEATYDFHRPIDHGPVVAHSTGHPVDLLAWLLGGTGGG